MLARLIPTLEVVFKENINKMKSFDKLYKGYNVPESTIDSEICNDKGALNDVSDSEKKRKKRRREKNRDCFNKR